MGSSTPDIGIPQGQKALAEGLQVDRVVGISVKGGVYMIRKPAAPKISPEEQGKKVKSNDGSGKKGQVWFFLGGFLTPAALSVTISARLIIAGGSLFSPKVHVRIRPLSI
jgi:hypothetical protein